MFNKKTVFVISLIIFLLSVYTSYSYFSGGEQNRLISPLLNYQPPKPTNDVVQSETEPKTEECPLNGQMMTKKQKEKWETRRPLGIMVENHKEARPQSGLSTADIIYEAVAEGGITRFLAVYYCQDSSYVGPVRSARVHFIRLLQEYGDYPLYAHVGGANCDRETGSGCANGAPADALGLIGKLDWSLFNDLNQFAVPFPYFWRDPERLQGRATEHTVYSSTTKLWQYASQKRKLTNLDSEGKSWDLSYRNRSFKDGAKPEERGTVNKIEFGFWTTFASDYAVVWNYDKKNNLYKRDNGGQPHLDKNNNKQLEAKNIVIVYANESPANDGYEGGRILYKLVGNGDGLIFQEGNAIKITWNKKDNEAEMKFFTLAGKEISFVRGQIFFEILPIGNKVNY